MRLSIKILLQIGVLIPAAILSGWVLTKLWLWFIVPPFGLPALGVVQAMGINLTITYLTRHDDPDIDENKKKMDAFIARAIWAYMRPCLIFTVAICYAWFL